MAKKEVCEEEEAGGSFRVVDRRRFTQEGESRQEAGEQHSADVAAAAKDKNSTSSAAAAGASQAAAAAEDNKAAAAGEASGDAASSGNQQQPDARNGERPPITFELFMQSLGQQAMMAMGLLPWPESGLVKVDLQRAREMIDVIGLLHDKTKGNLTANEQKLCETLVYQLRVTFVQIVQQGGKPPGAQPAPGAAKPPQAS
ncbi:MAG: DUF1844 domain-containing protein [Myxococcota bacterium]